MKRANSSLLVASSLLAFLSAGSTLAAPPPMEMAVDADDPSLNNQNPNGTLGFMSGISRSGEMLGDMWGLRPWLGRYGVTLAVQETSEVLGNVTGGLHEGFKYDGLTQVAMQLDTQRVFGWYGGTFNASALQIHGRNLSADNLGTLQTASGIEADDKTRLWELWYQQKFLDQDRLDIKVGQQSLDQEFMTSQNANYFINTMFGWPMVPSADLSGGGPAYPLSGLGVRVRAKPTDSLTFLAGVFNGSPMHSTDPNPDSQMANPHGTSFPLGDGILAIAEVQYAYPSLGSMVNAGESQPLARVYKLGIWYDSENFADEEFTSTGASFASAPNGIPAMHHGNYSIYAVADQMLWHSENIDDRTLNFFTRIMGTPQTDRNLVDFSANAGLTLHEPIFGRDDDTLGIGMGYTQVSPSVAALERQETLVSGFTPVQRSEAYVEATYQMQVTPWWQIQPDVQYVFDPGAGIVNPNTNQKVENELVIGIRTNILF